MRKLFLISNLIVCLMFRGSVANSQDIDWNEIRQFIVQRSPDERHSIVKLRFRDSQTGETIPEMFETRLPAPEDWMSYTATSMLSRVDKYLPLNGTIFCYFDYRPLELKGVRTPPDTLALITIRMVPGDSKEVIRSDEAWSCCIDTAYFGLEQFLPQNSVRGFVHSEITQTPIPGVELYCEETCGRTKTDDSGYYRIELGEFKQVTLHAWHPLYDSISFSFEKIACRSSKTANITFEGRRDRAQVDPGATTTGNQLLLIGLAKFGPEGQYAEFDFELSTHNVKPGEIFGRTDSWLMYDCLPFGLMKIFPNDGSLATFLHDVGLRGITGTSGDKATILDTADSSIGDGHYLGTKLTLALVPDYAPRNTLAKTLQEELASRNDPQAEVPDLCDSIRAEIERIHIQNYLHFVGREFKILHQEFSPKFSDTSDGLPLTTIRLDKMRSALMAPSGPTQRLGTVFDLQRSEVYVHGMCDETPYARYVHIMEKANLPFRTGDVYVRFPFREGTIHSDAFSLVYRKEGGQWKIICR